MAVNNNNVVIAQICSVSGLSGKALDDLRLRLSKMTEVELQRELSQLLSGGSALGEIGLVIERATDLAGVKSGKQEKVVKESIVTEAQGREVACTIIDENLREAFSLLNSQHLGDITGGYDRDKAEDDKLRTSNVVKVLEYQKAGLTQIIEAKNEKLTRRQYYEENKQRIKDIILTRLNVLKTETGVGYIDELRGKYSKDELTEIINKYVENLCSMASLEKLKEIQLQFISYTDAEERDALTNFVAGAKKFAELGDTTKYSSGVEGKNTSINGPDRGIVPLYWDSDKPVSFGEVYKFERGCEYSQIKVEKYVQSKIEMETVVNAYNKKQQFVDFAEGLRKEELSFSEKSERLLAGFAEYYVLAEDGGESQLQKIIDKSKLGIVIEDGKLNLDVYSDDASRVMALDKLLKFASQEKEREFETLLGDKSFADYQWAYEKSYQEILGEENGKILSEAMLNDNMGVIKRYTGTASMIGMGIVAVGGLLCFAPIGAVTIGLGALGSTTVSGLALGIGNTLAIGGIVAKNGLGGYDYATKDVQTQEELVNLSKDFVVDAGGFIIGMKAGQAGMMKFKQLIDKKLVAVFGEQVASGNKIEALKTVFSNPEYLKSFSKAAGAKISTDFLISYLGDLIMMGVLDTQDDWQSLLQANLTGILFSLSGDLKDIAGAGSRVGVSFDETKLNDSMLEGGGGKDILNEVEQQTAVSEPVEVALVDKLSNASTREDFVIIREEIKSMPEGVEKTALQQEYVRKWNEYSRRNIQEHDIRMEYNESGRDLVQGDKQEGVVENKDSKEELQYTALKEQDWYASLVFSACKIDGRFDENMWQRALELEKLGFKNDAIESVISVCHIKEGEGRRAKVVGFNDELYAKAKMLREEYGFNPEYMASILKGCLVEGKVSQKHLERAIDLRNKIDEGYIFEFIEFPEEGIDFALRLKNQYGLKEMDLKRIIHQCIDTVEGKQEFSNNVAKKVEELITQ